MEGIGDGNIKRPYVLVKKEFDTISVIKSNDRGKIIKYINQGDYWYTILQIEEKSSFLDRHRICEKFISNDTVIEYEYILKNNLKRFDQNIFVHTKKDCVILVIQDNDIKNFDAPYNEIKKFVINYKEIFPLYSPGYQPRCHNIFEKHIDGKVLSIYEIDDVSRAFISSKKMNSLGEFDNKGMLAWWW
jgi:hypothetical protein